VPEVAGSLFAHFSDLDDPRRYNRWHPLFDIVVIAICGVICGADDWPAVEEFGRAKYEWFKGFLKLPHGIPSHDTFGRVFGVLNAEQFQARFVEWTQAVQEITQGQVVAIDGKKLRRSHDKVVGKGAIHMVSAWASQNHLVLGQVKVDDRSNEITAVPDLLDLLELSGCIVTVDALNCQKKTAKKIVDQGADYVLSVKENQANLYQALQDLFGYAQETAFRDCDYAKTVNKGHGRIEMRECWTTSAPDYLAYLPDLADWTGLQTLVMVKAERRLGQLRTVEIRYYISSLPSNAQHLLQAVRGHWTIENEMHWVLDIAFREDDSRLRKGNGAHNFAILRHIALNLLKQEKTAHCGIKTKRLKAAWDHTYLLKVLTG